MSTASALAPTQQQSRSEGWGPWIVAISVMLATFMEVLDTAIASVALPYIAGSMSSTNSEATWVLTSYLVANAVILPASNWFALRFGRKRFLLTCVVIFTIASFFCGAAPTLGILLVARVIQGAGGGALQPLSQSILLESFPPQKRNAAMALFGFGIVVAPVLGPTLGGWLTDTYSWRYAFYINIPVGILAVLLISRFVHDPPYIKNAKAKPFDNLGFGLLAIWTGCLQIVLDKGQEDDWFGALWIRWAVTILVIALGWFIVHCWRKNDTAIVDLHVLKNWNFTVGCILISMLGLAIYITITVLPLYYQEVMGYTALTAGFVVGPRGIGSMLGLPLIGVLGHKVDNRILLSVGFIGFGICNLYFANIHQGIGPTTLLIPIMATGFALSGVFVPNATMATSHLKNHEMGNATGIFNLLRNIGGSIGISLAQTQLERRAAFHQTQIAASAPQAGYWLQQRIAALTAYWRHAQAHTPPVMGAWGTLYREMLQQAMLWAFVDVFRWTALLCFLCAAVAWLFQKVDPHGKSAEGFH